MPASKTMTALTGIILLVNTSLASLARKRNVSAVRRDIASKKREIQKLASALTKVRPDICSISQEMKVRCEELWGLQIRLNGLVNRADEKAILSRVQKRLKSKPRASSDLCVRCNHSRDRHDAQGCDVEEYVPDFVWDWDEHVGCPCAKFEESKDV